MKRWAISHKNEKSKRNSRIETILSEIKNSLGCFTVNFKKQRKAY